MFTVTTCDICARGFERLRSYPEIILVAYVDSDTDKDSVLEQWLDDIQACERPEGFDYDGARFAVYQFANSFTLPGDLPAPSEDGEESLCAYLYLKDETEGAHYPVYQL